MGRKRKYKNNAEKQKAYRERQRQKFTSINGEQLTQNIVTKRNAQHTIKKELQLHGSLGYRTLDSIHILLFGKQFRNGTKKELAQKILKKLELIK